MIFTNKTNIAELKIKVNDQDIQKVCDCMYLGLTIDNELKWNKHIDNIYHKLIKFTSIFFKLRDNLPKEILKQIYFAFIHPHILYGVELYANTSKNHLEKLMKLNNKLLRILQHQPVSAPINQLYMKYFTLPIPELHKLQLCLFVHKFIHHPELLPDIFKHCNYFVHNERVHIYDTRNKANLHLLSSRTACGQRNSQYKAAILWNDLPTNLKDTVSTSVFKRCVKHYLSPQ